jgi:hypothetical protein
VPRAPRDTDTSFDSLARQVLRWMVAAALPEKKGFYSADYIDNSVVVSPDDLAVLLTAKNFGRLYIENQIVLLGYRMYGNAWFKVTNPGLPISHSDDPPSHLAADRTRTPMRAALDDSPPWKFQRAIPAAHNAVPTQQKSANLPAPGDSPYAGVGGLAQLELGWVDVFGNTVKSDIGNNPDGTPTRNRPPLPLNYVDALIGFGQWSGVSADYSVLTPNNGSPTISLGLSFDPSGYSPIPTARCRRPIRRDGRSMPGRRCWCMTACISN